MQRLFLYFYWYWYSTWIYRFYFEQTDFIVLIKDGLYQTGFIWICSVVHFFFTSNTKEGKKWFLLCITSGTCRFFTFYLAYNGIKTYNYFFIVTVFILFAIHFINKSFEHNSNSVNPK